MGTIGGNLCLDTRCNYWDQSFEWRKAIGFCLKRDGDTCWVAPGSRRCLAVSSTDAAPALLALDASVEFAAADGVRQVRVADLYRNDGIDYIARRPNELLTRIRIPPADGWRSTYWKVRRRGAFDFPVVSVAAAVRLARDSSIEDARIVVGSVASCPIDVPEAAQALIGGRLSDAAVAEAAERAARPAKPMDNTDFALVWRKRLVRDVAGYALRELRGDDIRVERRRVAHVQLM
jgi:4-hydroxybenzoyl-CoA reductase subunit beta